MFWIMPFGIFGAYIVNYEQFFVRVLYFLSYPLSVLFVQQDKTATA